MKKVTLIVMFLAILLGMFAAEVIIGTGTTYNSSTDYPAVYGNYYKNAREQFLITPAEFAANGGGAGAINSIAFNVYALNGVGARPMIIKMGNSALSALTTTFVTGLTTVKTYGTYTPVVGWNVHTFDTAFTWDGTSSVVVEVFYGDLAQTYTYNTGVYYSATTDYKAMYYRSDSVDANAQLTGTLSYNRPNMKFDMAAGGAMPPFPANLVSPANGSTFQSVDTILNWSSGGGNPQWYNLYFGITSPPPLIGNVGMNTSYDPTLVNNQTYYWQVVPQNAQGPATGCPIWSFTTAPEGTVWIGNGADVAPMLPINAYYGYTYSQSIYQAADLGGAGIINTVGYYWNGAAAGLASNDWTIYMGTTPNTAFASTTDWLPLSSLTQVFTGPVTLPATPGWVTIPLATPFVYNGTSNLVIGVDENQYSYDYPYGQFYCTATPGISSLLYFDDTVNPDPAAPPAAMYTRTNIPNTLLVINDIPAAAPGAPIPSYPDNGATGIPLSGWNLQWNMNPLGGLPDYYELYLKQGDDYDITNEYNYMFDNLTATSFNPAANGVTFQYNETWYWAVQAVNGDGDAIFDPPWRFDITPPPPGINVTPGSLTETLEFGQTSVQTLTIQNTGGLPLNYSIGFQDTTVRSTTGITPYDPTQVSPANLIDRNMTERAPYIGPVVESDIRAIFDVQFSYPTFLNDGEYGVATDGTYIYTSDWSSVAGGVDIAKYALDGTYIEEFSIPGASNCRDLAFDGTYFYGAANSTTIYQMDFTAHTLIGTITSPVPVRGIAYDPDNDAFWVGNNWDADLRLINRSGTQLAALTPAIASFAGLAYDNLSGPNPTLWGNTQNGTTSNTLAQIDITTGAVLQSLDITTAIFPDIVAGTHSAGGLEIFNGLVPGTATLLGNIQNLRFYGMELCELPTWAAAVPRTGTVPAYSSTVVDIEFDATSTSPGVHTGIFTVSHNAPTPAVQVPVTLTITGNWPPEFAIDPTSWNFGNVEQLNPSSKQFTITNPGGPSLNLNPGDIYLTGNAEGNFSVVADGLPVSLGHNGTYSFTVNFVPQTTGAKTATLNIQDNRMLQTVALSGTGIAEEIGQVVNLQASVQNNENVVLTWALASGTPGTPGWLHYDDGTNADGIGTGGAVNLDVAIKIPSGTMYAYGGMELTKINFFPRSANTNYTLKVWTGLDANLAPTTLVYQQPVVPVPMQWNEILLTTPVPITGAEAVWFGYNCDIYVLDAATDDYYAPGCDAGPAVTNFGDLMYLNGSWVSINTAYGLNYNWNLQGYVDDPVIRGTRAPLLSIPVINNPLNKDIFSQNVFRTASNTPPRVLRGFNVFRDTVQINPALVTAYTYTDFGLPAGNYSYTVQAVYYSQNSAMSAPAFATITPPVPYDLPFFEDWASSSFATKQWVTDSSNWLISAGTGNAAPSALFNWSPQATNYSSYLTSYMMDGTDLPNITLKFDLFLDWYSDLGDNYMAYEVWDGTTWHTLGTISAQTGANIPWTTYQADITPWAFGHNFKIRFNAYGANSFEIDGWYIDNISLELGVATLDAPVVNINLVTGLATISWAAVTNANSYKVYGSNDPYAAGPWTLLGSTNGLSYQFNGPDAYKFFKVVASTD